MKKDIIVLIDTVAALLKAIVKIVVKDEDK